MNRAATIALWAIVLTACASRRTVDHCSYNKEALLSLDEQSFDQDLSDGGGGWRRIASLPGCELAAADLLASYREAHPSSSITLLTWHEGQLRASAGEYRRAIPLLVSAKMAPDRDKAGWNAYVDATVAFLEGHKPELLRARDRLADVPFITGPGMPPLKAGYIEFPAKEGQPAMKVRWPPNLDVVDELVTCFGRPYEKVYGNKSCLPKTP